MNPFMRIAPPDDAGWSSVWLWCPGCDDSVRIVVGPFRWTWDGDLENPTFNPSLLTKGHQWPMDSPAHKPRHRVEPGGRTVCHSFIRAGQWEFLTDSTHVLSGQTVPMVPLPDWLVGEAS